MDEDETLTLFMGGLLGFLFTLVVLIISGTFKVPLICPSLDTTTVTATVNATQTVVATIHNWVNQTTTLLAPTTASCKAP